MGGNDTVNGDAGNDIINGGTGNDTLNGDAGDDTFIWNANSPRRPDGSDGGRRQRRNRRPAGDTFVINGNAHVAETYRIYTRAALRCASGNSGQPQRRHRDRHHPRRDTDFAASVIAELTEIEEIRINGVDPAGQRTSGGDTFEIIGDFSGTSLRLNTITIDGEAGNDTIDISALSSAHRIVFRSNGGHDTIVGTLRPQDVIEVPAGLDPSRPIDAQCRTGTAPRR